MHGNNVKQLQAALRQRPGLATGRGSDGQTLLHIAAKTGSTDCLRLLLTAGTSIDAVEPQRDVTALHMVAQQGHEACMRELLLAGANVEATAKDGGKPLHLAAIKGQLGCLQQLLDAGVQVDALNVRGATALSIAAFNGHEACVRTLLGQTLKQQTSLGKRH